MVDKTNEIKKLLFENSFFCCPNCFFEPFLCSIIDDEIKYKCFCSSKKIMNHLKKFLQQNNENISQFNCDGCRKPANFYCMTCSNYICNKCKYKFGCQKEIITKLVPYCQICKYKNHGKEYVEKICLDCEIPLCKKYHPVHPNHSYFEEKIRSELLDKLFNQKEVISKYEFYLNNIQKLFQNDQTFIDIKEKIIQYLKLQKMIINNFLEWKDNIVSIYNMYKFKEIVPVYLNLDLIKNPKKKFLNEYIGLLSMATEEEEKEQFQNTFLKCQCYCISNFKKIFTKNGFYYGNILVEELDDIISSYFPLKKLIGYQNYQIDGFGIKLYTEGIYIGSFLKGKRNGKGKFEYQKSKNNNENILSHYNKEEKKDDYYEGEWENDLKNGNGIYLYSNGDKYEGEWKDNMKNGFGIYHCENGDKYEGEWKNGLIEGIGEYTLSIEEQYIGLFKEGLLIEGKYKTKEGECYEGEWDKGKMNGYGFFKSINKEFYCKFNFDKLEGYLELKSNMK